MISRRGVGSAGALLLAAFISLLVVPAISDAAFMLGGRTSQGLPVRVRLSDNLSTIDHIVIRWRAPCTGGAILVDTGAGRAIHVKRFLRFHSALRYTTPSASYNAANVRKLMVVVSGQLQGELLFGGRVRGTWSATARVQDGNHALVDSCRTGLVRWRATLSPSPPPATLATGKTSQDGVVRVFVGRHNVITGLTIELRTRCTDHTRRDVWPGFEAPFKHPLDAAGALGDSYDIVGRDGTAGVRFRQQASFTARLRGNTLTGSARVKQTLIPAGVICKSPRVTFSAHI